MDEHTAANQTIQLSPATIALAQKRAAARGMTLSEYIESILNDPWRQPVPNKVVARWKREIKEFEEEDKINPRPSAKTAAEFRKLLEEEAAQLPDDEED
jgi:hypothetical protein